MRKKRSSMARSAEALRRALRRPEVRMLLLLVVVLLAAAPSYAQSQSYFAKPLEAMWNQWKGGVVYVITLFLSWSAISMFRGEMFAKETLVLTAVAGAVMFYAYDIAQVVFP